MKPPFPYFGGKINIGPAIAALLPPHEHYVEPFCGSLAVLLAKSPSRMETVNDLDQDLVTFWRVLREREEDLRRVCEMTPHSRAEFAASIDLAVPDDLERARRVWVRLTQGRAACLRHAGWRHYVDPSNASVGMPRYLEGYLDRMPPVVRRLRAVSLECRPALEVIAQYGKSPAVLLYVDPPYLGHARASSDQQYQHELMSDDEHRALAKALQGCRATVVISGYPSELYDRELYHGWDRHEIPASTGQHGASSERTEVLWSNREFPSTAVSTLFDLTGDVA